MRLNFELAQRISERCIDILQRNVNIHDENGIILGSGEKQRIGTFHEGASQVVQTGNPLEISHKNVRELKGVKPGINLPISYNGKIVGAFGITGEPDEVRGYGNLVKGLVELMLQQVDLLEQVRLVSRAKEDLAYNLIKGELDNDLILGRTKTLGYEPYTTRAVMMAEIVGNMKYNCSSEGNAELTRQKLRDDIVQQIEMILGDQDLVALSGSNEIVILKACSPRDGFSFLMKQAEKIQARLDRTMNTKLTIGISDYFPDIFGIPRAYKQAVMALKVGQRLHGAEGLYLYRNLGLGFLLDGISREVWKAFSENVMSDVHWMQDQVIMETLEAFFNADMNISKAAKDLYVHRNTLIHRLNKIHEITGLNPRKFDEATLLYLAVSVSKYQYLNQAASS